MSELLLVDVRDHVCTLKLNRPDSFNALNNELSYALMDALRKAARDPGVRVLVLTAEGEKAFCSGQDLKDRAGVGNGDVPHLGDSVRDRYNPLVRLITQTEKPVLCRLNGLAAGAGAGLALACDYVVAAESSYFLFAFANIGLVPDTGSSFTLPSIVGRRRAFEMMTLGEKIPASQALQLGMVNQVVPMDQLDEATQRMAQRYAERPPLSMAIIKRMLNKAADGASLDEMLEQERLGQETAGRSQDFVEGVMAFLQKRKAVFTGK